MESSYLAGPSLAAATGTRLDSAAKHIQQCRVSQDHMQELVSFDKQADMDELIRNKYRYCVHKDEFVIGLGRSWVSKKKYQNSAYPKVISNLGRLGDITSADGQYNDAIKMVIYLYHNATSLEARDKIIDAFNSSTSDAMDSVLTKVNSSEPYWFVNKNSKDHCYSCKEFIPYMYDYIAVGYANTLGWAHAHSGDTMTSVHIGGLRTVMNGHFEILCGDTIQWYWPFEVQCFTRTGKRKKCNIKKVTGSGVGDNITFVNSSPFDVGDNWTTAPEATTRQNFNNRQYGQKRGVEKLVPLIKSYKQDSEHPRVYDWYRVFGVAISSARPFEAVDIRISRQAL